MKIAFISGSPKINDSAFNCILQELKVLEHESNIILNITLENLDL